MKPVLFIVALVLVAGVLQKSKSVPIPALPPVSTASKMVSTTPDFEAEVEQIRRYQQYYPGRNKAFDAFMTDYLVANWA